MQDLNAGDIALILVDDIKEIDDMHPLGRTHGSYVMFVEIDAFNEENKVPTHEVGHMIGNLVHSDDPNHLMTLNQNGEGYDLGIKDFQNIMWEFINRKGMEERHGGSEYYNTPEDIQEWWNEYVRQ
jgi:hypothetical protein